MNINKEEQLLRITIDGPIKGGKTVISNFIGRCLFGKGFSVTLKDDSKLLNHRILRMALRNLKERDIKIEININQ